MVVSAPLGAVFISVFGPILLPEGREIDEDGEDDEESPLNSHVKIVELNIDNTVVDNITERITNETVSVRYNVRVIDL